MADVKRNVVSTLTLSGIDFIIGYDDEGDVCIETDGEGRIWMNRDEAQLLRAGLNTAIKRGREAHVKKQS